MRTERGLRALVVTDSLIWTAEAEYAVEFARAEAAMGVDVTFACPLPDLVAAPLVSEADVRRMPGARPSSSPADFLADVRWTSRLVDEVRPDFVHSSRSSAHLIAALAVGSRAPLIHLRGGAGRPKGHPLNRFLYRRCTRVVIASSRRVRDWVVERTGVSRERVHRILLPVDVHVFRSSGSSGVLASDFGVDASTPVVVDVARLAPVKGHSVLLEAMAEVAREMPGARLVLVGEAWSGQPEALMRQAEVLGLSGSVVFAGRRDDVPAILAEADVCVSSSLGSEENSRAVSEYMAAGRPVVATEVGVVPELVAGGTTGVLVPPGDADALARGILAVLSNPETAARMGRAGRERAVETFSREAFAGRLSSILSQVGVETCA